MVVIKLTRISNARHRFEYVREDGTGEAVELETKSLLFHDLVHFAVETEAALTNSFYGLLARHATFAKLRMESFGDNEELATTEKVVGLLTGFLKSNLDPEQLAERAAAIFAASGDDMPAWLTPEFMSRVKERMRRLLGEWHALPFHETMQLSFDASVESASRR